MTTEDLRKRFEKTMVVHLALNDDAFARGPFGELYANGHVAWLWDCYLRRIVSRARGGKDRTPEQEREIEKHREAINDLNRAGCKASANALRNKLRALLNRYDLEAKDRGF